MTLGHTRLSIIGLDNGAQPISSRDGASHIVVNGEFYGYRELRDGLRKQGVAFATESDSEVALHLYQRQGTRAFSSLRGEFAMVIADTRSGEMIAVRDRFGVKPLYYAVVRGEVYFASEVKALLALGVPAAWDLYSVSGFMSHPHERTMFAGVRAVPPGCYAIASGGEVSIYPYWDWEMPSAEDLRSDARTEEEIVSEFRQALADSVKQRLVADVEVACYLSGGIDSCAVLGLAQQQTDRPIRAFTLSFEDSLYDESAAAQAEAKRIGADYHAIRVSSRNLADAYSDALWHAETILFNGNAVAKFLLSRAVRDAGIKVVFPGEGADELLGGYPFYRVDALNHNPALSEAERAALIHEMFGSNEASRAVMMPQEFEDRGLAAIERRLGWRPAWAGTVAAMTNSIRPFYRRDAREALDRSEPPVVAALDRMNLAMRVTGRDHLNQSLYITSKFILPNMIMTTLGDRMEMAHSIEGRVPYLDHVVAETSARVPVDLKVRGTREKHILREAAKDVLSPQAYERQKHPFTAPPTRDAKDPLMQFYRDVFASRAARQQPVFDPDVAQRALTELMTCAPDQRIAVEGIVQRIAGVIVLHERFGFAS